LPLKLEKVSAVNIETNNMDTFIISQAALVAGFGAGFAAVAGRWVAGFSTVNGRSHGSILCGAYAANGAR
jgi:hypothetical protein